MTRKHKEAHAPGKVAELLRQAHEPDLPEVVPAGLRQSPLPDRLSRATGDDGEVLGHAIEITDRKAMFTAFKLDDTPLGRLYRRKGSRMTEVQFLAGERYYSTVYMAGYMPSGVVDREKPMVDRSRTGEDTAGARKKAGDDYAAIKRGMDYNHWHALNTVVIEGWGLAEYAQRFRHNEARVRQAVAYDRLQCALDWLADFYRIKPPKHRNRAYVGERPVIQPSPSDS